MDPKQLEWSNPHVAAEPTWDVALLFPEQGTWSEEEYLALAGNHLVEFSHGFVEVLPLPTDSHQAIVAYLYRVFLAVVSASQPGGTVRFAPLRLRLWPGKFREPDVMVLRVAADPRRGAQFWQGADLVVEVVSTDDRRRDLVVKRREYARASIPEYWIVDPEEQRITVLRLDGEAYAVHGEFGPADVATSALLDGVRIDVAAALAAD